MKTYTLTLTEDQAEIIGYCLTKTLRAENATIEQHGTGSIAWNGAHARAHRIEQVRDLLDTAPEVEAT